MVDAFLMALVSIFLVFGRYLLHGLLQIIVYIFLAQHAQN